MPQTELNLPFKPVSAQHSAQATVIPLTSNSLAHPIGFNTSHVLNPTCYPVSLESLQQTPN